jgi:hypothetical protein
MDKNIKSDLTYTAPGGKRKVRRYVVAALIIIVVAAGLIVVGIYERNLQVARMFPTPTATSTQSPLPTVSTTAPVAVASVPAPTGNNCPADASTWSLVQVGYNNYYDRIDPPCVYDGLGKTIAYVQAINMGYSRADANALLGFSFDPTQNNPAMVQVQNITILTMSNWAVAKQNMFSSPANLDFTEWSVTGDGAPSLTFSMLGCFQTRTIAGNQSQDWGDGYPVLCVVAMDAQKGYHVTTFGGHLYTSPLAQANRELALFGYAGNNRWVWLGTEIDVLVDQSGISLADLQKGYQIYSQSYQSPTWDAQWVKDHYGVAMKPLPNGWQSANSATELKAITDLLNNK